MGRINWSPVAPTFLRLLFDSLGGFHKWGIPQMDDSIGNTIEIKSDDLGVPLFQDPPLITGSIVGFPLRCFPFLTISTAPFFNLRCSSNPFSIFSYQVPAVIHLPLHFSHVFHSMFTVFFQNVHHIFRMSRPFSPPPAFSVRDDPSGIRHRSPFFTVATEEGSRDWWLKS